VVHVRHYDEEVFLLIFQDRLDAGWVLYALQPDEVELHLIFRRWRQQSGVLFSPLFFKVLLSIGNIPAHIWLVELAQTVVGSSCLIFDVSPASADGSDMSQFLEAG
jgi:hypothetical protein